MDLFWDKYDRYTTYNSFFEINYGDFVPPVSSRDYDNILRTKYCEDLLDDYLNALKLFLIQSIELLETTYTSELCLCSQKRLIGFMENVLQYLRIERLYLSYLIHPFQSGISAGENTITSSLLRLNCLLKDFQSIVEFGPQKEQEDFENAKELIYNLSEYFTNKLKKIRDSYGLLESGYQKTKYNNEHRVVLELVSFCEKIASSQTKRASDSIDSGHLIEESYKTNDTLPYYNNSSSPRSEMLHSFKNEAKIISGFFYQRLEAENPNYSKESKTEANLSDKPSYIEKSMKKYNVDKYDRDKRENNQNQLDEKNITTKEAVKEGLSVLSVFKKRNINHLLQDFGKLSFQENIHKHSSSEICGHKFKRFPLTYLSYRLKDSDRDPQQTELLSLLNFDYDPHTGWKIITTEEQKTKLKQITSEREEKSKLDNENNHKVSTEGGDKLDSNTNSEEEEESDEEIEDMNIRELAELTQRRRKNVDAGLDVEFQEINSGLNIEPTYINNYAFYENIFLRYEKPPAEYLLKTEKVFERPTMDIIDVPNDSAFMELSPELSRKQFLASIYGNKQEEKIQSKLFSGITATNLTEITNNTTLKMDVLKDMSRQIEGYKTRAHFVSETKSESVGYFLKHREEEFKLIDRSFKQRKERMCYLWKVVRDFFAIRLFYRKNCKKSARKELDILKKLKEMKLLSLILKGQDSLVIHQVYQDHLSGKQNQFVVLNRVITHKLKFDYIYNFEAILKPAFNSESMP